jgi:hypothetical protein
MVEESNPDEKPDLTLEWFPQRGKGQRGKVGVSNGDEAPYTDRLDIAKPAGIVLWCAASGHGGRTRTKPK